VIGEPGPPMLGSASTSALSALQLSFDNITLCVTHTNVRINHTLAETTA